MKVWKLPLNARIFLCRVPEPPWGRLGIGPVSWWFLVGEISKKKLPVAELLPHAHKTLTPCVCIIPTGLKLTPPKGRYYFHTILITAFKTNDNPSQQAKFILIFCIQLIFKIFMYLASKLCPESWVVAYSIFNLHLNKTGLLLTL